MKLLGPQDAVLVAAIDRIRKPLIMVMLVQATQSKRLWSSSDGPVITTRGLLPKTPLPTLQEKVQK